MKPMSLAEALDYMRIYQDWRKGTTNFSYQELGMTSERTSLALEIIIKAATAALNLSRDNPIKK